MLGNALNLEVEEVQKRLARSSLVETSTTSLRRCMEYGENVRRYAYRETRYSIVPNYGCGIGIG